MVQIIFSQSLLLSAILMKRFLLKKHQLTRWYRTSTGIPASNSMATSGPIASLRSRRMAEELGVDQRSIRDTGLGGKITDRDVQAVVGS
jgi:hypothetical protein